MNYSRNQLLELRTNNGKAVRLPIPTSSGKHSKQI